MEMNQRLSYVDAMKAVAIILVVIGHVLAACKTEQMASWDEMVVWKWIYSFHMPLFMFVSGFVCFNPMKNYSAVQIGKRLLTYMLPFFVTGLLLGLVRGGINFGVLWYFRTLTIFVVILYVGRLLSNLFLAQLKGRWVHVGTIIVVSLVYLICVKIILKVGGQYDWFDVIFDTHDHLNHLYVFFLTGWLLRNLSQLDKYLRNDYALTISFFLCIVSLRFPIYFSIFHFHSFLWIWFTMNLCSLPLLYNNIIINKIGGGHCIYLHTAFLSSDKDAFYGRIIHAIR